MANKNDWLIVFSAMLVLLILMVIARQAPTTKDVLGSQWCANQGLALDNAVPGKTKRPPYHVGGYEPKIKLTIICKKSLH